MTLAPAFAILAGALADATSKLGATVHVGQDVLDRSDARCLGTPSRLSANGSCRLVAARDGWLAINLPRATDRELLPAWLGMEEDAGWAALEKACAARSCARLLGHAHRLGLAVTRLGETRARTPLVQVRRQRWTAGARLVRGPAAAARREVRVVDMSSLWAGPLCGGILAQAGLAVTKVESTRRPDTTATALPALDSRLNAGKARLRLDLDSADGQAALRACVVAADIVITSARPRALPPLGLDPAAIFAANPSLVWVAITGFGFLGPPCRRVAFGDDAAVAGGLVGWRDDGPVFLGDALADPLTGLAAAIGALRGLAAGGGVLVDAALARVAAGAARCATR